MQVQYAPTFPTILTQPVNQTNDVGTAALFSVVATGTEKSTEEDKARIVELMGPEARMISDNDQTALLQTFHDCRADILIAGDRYIYPTLKSRIPVLDIDHVRDIGYAGYDGMIELARQVAAAIDSPVWQQVKQPAPWALPSPLQAVAA